MQGYSVLSDRLVFYILPFDADECSGMAKNLTKGDGIVQFTDEDCEMAVGLANRRCLTFR